MIFLLSALAVTASGYALLRATRLTVRPAVDAPLSWLVGAAWLGWASFVARGLLGIPSGPVTAGAVLLLPFAGWAASHRLRTRSASPETAGEGPPPPPRWIPRPAWLFVPMTAWTVLVAAAVVLHGLGTPIHTDDSYRVRAYAPVLAATGDWSDPARAVVAMAGPVPTYLPALAWTLGAEVDPVHVSATVILTFLALLALLVCLGSARGVPEAGWGGAFALTSMPLFAYHATSTYADGWLACYLAAAFAFLVAHGRGGSPGDAARTLLLLLGAAMVKREGELVALPVAAALLAQVAWREPAGKGKWLRLAPILGAWAALFLARLVAFGSGNSVPFLLAAGQKMAGGAPAAAAAAAPSAGGLGPGVLFLQALFTEGNLGLLWWVFVPSVLLLVPRIRGERQGLSLAALAVLLAQAAASAIWLYPEFTLNHTTVHRSLLPVSAAAAVWLAALLAPPAPPAAAARGSGKRPPRRRGG